MLRNDKIEWIWNYVKEAKHNDMDYESLQIRKRISWHLLESDEFLNIVIEDICEYENWSVHGLITK